LKNKLRLICGKIINSPKGIETRPTTSKVREAVINILQWKLKDSNWLDLCSGSGIMACEAIEKGAQRVLAVELNKKSAQICKSNLISASSGLTVNSHLEVICDEVVRTLKKGCKKQSHKFIDKYPDKDYRFDFIYIDPPYKSGLYKLILENLITGDWLTKNSVVICEFSNRLIPDIPSNWLIKNKKSYGSIGLFFLIPNQALSSLDDIDSKLLQKDQQ
tara:strand:- start:2503 stop:3156 length:654 start_codon:yes stop_codon:yes gene_type:complete